MRQVNKKKGKDKVAATIMLCFCLIALTSIFTIKASIDKISKSAGDLPVTQEAPTAPQTDNEKDLAKESSKESDPLNEEEEIAADTEETDIPASSQVSIVDSEDTTRDNAVLLPPMNMDTASIMKKYSMDMVIYNKTLDQYMTHPGIDLEAPSKSGVHAVADGTITNVYQDDCYGTTIEITHNGDLVSKYCNLETDGFVEIGDVVTQGQQISTIGRTALYESMDQAHLHFELYKDGQCCNPADYITF